MTTTYKSTGTPYLSEEFNTVYTSGRAEGLTEGLAEGRTEGLAEGRAHSLLTILRARGIEVTPSAAEVITSTTDVKTFETWINRAATAATLEDVLDIAP